MKKSGNFGDKLAVSLSLACGVHCFLAPVLVALLPSLKALSITQSPDFHFWMLFCVLPTSMYTLTMGCQKHKRFSFLVFGFLGLGIVTFAAIWGHDLFGCKVEKYITLLGSSIICLAHFRNYLECRKAACANHDPCL